MPWGSTLQLERKGFEMSKAVKGVGRHLWTHYFHISELDLGVPIRFFGPDASEGFGSRRARPGSGQQVAPFAAAPQDKMPALPRAPPAAPKAAPLLPPVTSDTSSHPQLPLLLKHPLCSPPVTSSDPELPLLPTHTSASLPSPPHCHQPYQLPPAC